MATFWYHHDDCLGHVTPPGHPERVERLHAVDAALTALGGLDRRAAPLAQDADIRRAHPQGYIDRVTGAEPAEGWAALDPDTQMSPGSVAAARRAVGAMVAAVDAVMTGRAANAFVGCRPPGHHAEKTRAMGFCLFGNAAIAALRALDHHGAARVAVLDFDVHHGNGTQAILWDEPRTLYCSSHQMPLFPGTGAATERGGHDNMRNAPLAAMTGSAEMRDAWRALLADVAAFAPDLVVISAGFDAHTRDPLASLDWKTGDYRWLTRAICDLAEDACDGRVVSTLEGGYDLQALGEGVAAHVGVLKEHGA